MGFFFREKRKEESESESESDNVGEDSVAGMRSEELAVEAVRHLEERSRAAEQTRLERRLRVAAEMAEADRKAALDAKLLAEAAAALAVVEAKELDEWDKRKSAAVRRLEEEKAAELKAEKKARKAAKKAAEAEKVLRKAERATLRALEAKAAARHNALVKKRDSVSAAFTRQQWLGECRAKAGAANALLRAQAEHAREAQRLAQAAKRAARPLPAEGQEHLDDDSDEGEEAAAAPTAPAANATKEAMAERVVADTLAKDKARAARRQQRQLDQQWSAAGAAAAGGVAGGAAALEAAPYAAARGLETAAWAGLGALRGFGDVRVFGSGEPPPPAAELGASAPKGKAAGGRRVQAPGRGSDAGGPGLLTTANPLKAFGVACW